MAFVVARLKGGLHCYFIPPCPAVVVVVVAAAVVVGHSGGHGITGGSAAVAGTCLCVHPLSLTTALHSRLCAPVLHGPLAFLVTCLIVSWLMAQVPATNF